MKKFLLALVAAFDGTVAALAQDVPKDINVNVETEGDAWYASPIVWVIGAAVFILLLVALTRGGRRAD